MPHYRLGVALFAWLLLLPMAQITWSGPLQLTLYLNNEAREFLSEGNQRILVVLPVPESQGAATVVALAMEPPLADRTTLLLELDAELYIAMRQVAPLEIIKQGVTQQVTEGQAYSFNGYRINGEGVGLAGYFSLYFDAPPNAQPVATGMSGFIYDSAAGKPTKPSPTSYYTVQLFQTQLIARTTPKIWILVGSGIQTGSLLPLTVLKPLTPSVSRVSGAYSAQSSLTLGRYYSVALSAVNNSSVHFEPALNAFVEGPYPNDGLGAEGDTVTLLNGAYVSR